MQSPDEKLLIGKKILLTWRSFVVYYVTKYYPPAEHKLHIVQERKERSYALVHTSPMALLAGTHRSRNNRRGHRRASGSFEVDITHSDSLQPIQQHHDTGSDHSSSVSFFCALS